MVSATPERLRIARELHDGIAQDLVGLGYSLDLLLASPELVSTPREQVRASRLMIDDLIAKVREEILELRRDSQVPFHLLLTDLAHELCSNQDLLIDTQEVSIYGADTHELLAISREILRNVTTHARATHVEVHLYSIDNRTHLEIRDNGVGGTSMKSQHWGLQGIQERVESLHGLLLIEENQGTHVIITI